MSLFRITDTIYINPAAVAHVALTGFEGHTHFSETRGKTIAITFTGGAKCEFTGTDAVTAYQVLSNEIGFRLG